MFNIYYSNDLEILKDILLNKLINNFSENIFPQEQIIIQTNSIKKWLQINISKKIGISFNKNLVCIERFFYSISKKLLKNISIPEINKDKFYIFFILLELIPKMIKEKKLIIFHKIFFKSLNDPLRFINLCYIIANIYYKYILYRTDWIVQWEEGKLVYNIKNSSHQKWQSELWQALVKILRKKKINLIHNIYYLIINYLNKIKPTKLSLFPKDLFIFNLYNIPIMYLNILRILSLNINIHFFVINPCKNYWLEEENNNTIIMSSFLKRNEEKTESNNELFLNGNNLLYKWGKAIKYNLINLLNIESVNITSFNNNYSYNLLNSIKKDILESDIKSLDDIKNSIYKKSYNISKKAIHFRDKSISINICFNIQHEVEVLYNYLLKLLHEKPNLEPNNILVIVSNMSLYAASIKGVFSKKNNSLPYNMSFFKNHEFKTFLKTFLKILNLPKSENSIDLLFSILEISFVRKKFKLSIEEIRLLYNLLKNICITKESNEKDIIKFHISYLNSIHNWKFILKRTLLGSIGSKIINNTYTFNSLMGITEELIGNLSNFLMYINKWYIKLSFKYSLTIWKKHILNIQKDLFFLETFEQNNIIKFNKLIYYAFLLNKEVAKSDKFSVEVIIYYLKHFLKKTNKDISYLPNFINFCSLDEMRSIPFKVICLLGMNEDLYRTVNTNMDFDLISSTRGYVNKNDVNKSIFLETILAAKDILYISYVGGFSIYNNKKRYPASVINDLLEYVKYNFFLENFPNAINSKSIISHICFYHDKDYKSSYKKFFKTQPNEKLKHNIKNLKKTRYKRNNKYNIICWNNFIKFWKHPIKEYWKFNYRFNLYNFIDIKNRNKNNLINYFYLYQIRKEILKQYFNNVINFDSLLSYYINSGILQNNSLYKEFFYKQIELIFNLYCNIKKHFLLNKSIFKNNYHFYIGLNSFKIYGHLNFFSDKELVKFKLSKLDYLDFFILYLEHILINFILGPKKSIIYGIKDQKFILNPITSPIQKKKDILIYYINGYLKGLKVPIFLPPRTTKIITRLIFNKISSSHPDILNFNSDLYTGFNLNIIDKIWYGNKFSYGEILEDIYIKKICFLNHIYNDYINILINNIKNWLYPIWDIVYKE